MLAEARDGDGAAPPSGRRLGRVLLRRRVDPIELYSKRLAEEHGFGPDEIDEIGRSVATYVDECAEKAVASPMPDPEIAMEGVFAESWEPLGDGEAPWSRWSATEDQGETGGDGSHATNGHRGAVVQNGRAA